MKLETFSYLPPMTEEQVVKQVRYVVEKGLVPAVEFADNPAVKFWSMWGLPMAGVRDVEAVMKEVAACRAAHPKSYVKIVGYDPVKQCQVVSFVVQRPGA